MAHCATCHTTFGGFRSFDRHRVNATCHTPPSLGLFYHEDRQCWCEPWKGTKTLDGNSPRKGVYG